MRAHDQAQPPPPPPPPLPPPLPQQLAVQPQQQLPQATCPICQNDIEPTEAVIYCNMCHKPCHRGETITWLITRRNNGYPQTCPTCRADMTWVLRNQQPVVAPGFVFPIPPHNPNNNTPPGLQPAELLLNINNWNWETGLE